MNPIKKTTKKPIKKSKEVQFILKQEKNTFLYSIGDYGDECHICGKETKTIVIDGNHTDCGEDLILCKDCINGLYNIK